MVAVAAAAEVAVAICYMLCSRIALFGWLCVFSARLLDGSR